MKCTMCDNHCGAVFPIGKVTPDFTLYGCGPCLSDALAAVNHSNGKMTLDEYAAIWFKTNRPKEVEEHAHWHDTGPSWFGKGCFNQCCQFEGSKHTDGPDWPKGLTPTLVYCNHGDNPRDHEGNCGPELCPLGELPVPEGEPVPEERVDGNVTACSFFAYPELQMLYEHWLDNPPERFHGLPWKLMTEQYGDFWKACIAVAFWRGFDLWERDRMTFNENSFEHAAWCAGCDHRRALIARNFGFETSC